MSSVVWSARSTNGRWGAEIVSATPVERWPARGRLTPLGERANITAFRFEADGTAPTWVLPSGDSWNASMTESTVVDGATVVWSSSLQSGRSGEIIVLGPTALLRWAGYKGRSAGYTLYREGVRSDPPVGVLLALGLIEPDSPPEPIPEPSPASGALQEALRRAGLA